MVFNEVVRETFVSSDASELRSRGLKFVSFNEIFISAMMSLRSLQPTSVAHCKPVT
jgi:hypothetical protein